MGFRLIITRPLEDAEILARELETIDVDSLITPLLSIDLFDSPLPSTVGVQALLVTSANGVRAFEKNSKERCIPVFAVGDASAKVASERGFKHIESASGDVQDLAELVCQKLDNTAGSLLHVAGTSLAGDLSSMLSKKGFQYSRIQLYQAIKAVSLSKDCVACINKSEIDGVVLYSPRTAKTFVDLMIKAGLVEKTKQLIAFCLSHAVAKKISKFDWAKIEVASTPDQKAVIESVKRLVSNR